MSSNWRSSANTPAGSVKISDINTYLKKINHAFISPIDRYYAHRSQVIIAGKPELLQDSPWLSGHMLVSIISATELYFREIFSWAIALCPVCKKNSSEKNMQIGAALWHGQGTYQRAVFEHLSLADSSKIKSCSKDYIGFEIKKTTSSHAALEEFDKLCELRHGIVHASCHLPGKNAVKLMVGKTVEENIVQFDTSRLHEGASICTALVESYNRELYECMVERWATSWRQTNDWTSAKELSTLKNLCKIFFSHNNPPTDRLSPIRLRNQIKKEFNL